MNPGFARAIIIVSSIAMVVLPHCAHGQRSRELKTAKRRKGPRESVSLALVALAFLLTFLWVATPALAFADYPLLPVPFILGILCLTLGLGLLHRSHAHLGNNWSMTLEVREEHQLVTQGLYRRIRHPMYLSHLVYSLGQALVLPNWVGGLSYGVALVLLLTLRIGREERMMLEEFGEDYASYMARTKRLFPGFW